MQKIKSAWSPVLMLAAIMSAVPLLAFGSDVFEVRATSTDATFYRRGKIEKDKVGEEVVYQVDIPSKTITRAALYNKNLPREQGGGLQSDNTVYTIMSDKLDPLVGGQRIIKAFGKVALLDGYETIVIGEDFVTTSRSSVDYFVLFSYKRTDDLADQFRMRKGGQSK